MARDANGRFLPGPDPDRHPLSKQDRQKGYAAARKAKMSSRVRAWLWNKVKRSCKHRRPVTDDYQDYA